MDDTHFNVFAVLLLDHLKDNLTSVKKTGAFARAMTLLPWKIVLNTQIFQTISELRLVNVA